MRRFALCMFLAAVAAADTLPWEDIPPSTPVDTNAVVTHMVSPYKYPARWNVKFEPSGWWTIDETYYLPYLDVLSLYNAESGGVFTDFKVSAVPEAKSIEDSEAPATVSFTYDDPDGAVASFEDNVFHPSGVAGTVRVTGHGSDGTVREAGLTMAPVPMHSKVREFAAETNITERYVWATNVFARIAAISTNAADMVVVSRFCRTKAGRFDQGSGGDAVVFQDWVAPRALNRFGTGGRMYTNEWAGQVAFDMNQTRTWCTVENEDFFWPDLRTNLWCFSVNCHETAYRRTRSNLDGMSAIAVAPHYVVTANHTAWMFGRTRSQNPRFRFRTGAGAENYVFCDFGGRAPSGNPIGTILTRPEGADLAVIRVSSTNIPDSCIARFAREDVLKALSLSEFKWTPGFIINGHQTLTPVALNGSSGWNGWSNVRPDASFSNPYLFPDDEVPGKVWDFEHVVHMFDSSSPFFLVAPNGRVVPVGTVYGTGGASFGGGHFTDDVLDAIDAAIRADSGGAESLRYWAFEDLWSGVGTNAVPPRLGD